MALQGPVCGALRSLVSGVSNQVKSGGSDGSAAQSDAAAKHSYLRQVQKRTEGKFCVSPAHAVCSCSYTQQLFMDGLCTMGRPLLAYCISFVVDKRD